jgi:hypothetical protein
MLAFLVTPIGKVVGGIALISFLVLSGWGLLKMRDASVRREALLEFNKKQMELVIQEQQEQKQRWENFEQNVLPKLFENISKELENTQRSVDSVESYLNSPEANKSDRPSSDILKETLRRLGAPK